VAWSGHLNPTGVRMAQSGQMGVSHSTHVSLVGTPCRTHVSPGGPSTAKKGSHDLGFWRLSADPWVGSGPMAETDPATIEAYQLEARKFPPAEEFKKDALVVDPWMYDDADRDWQGFWARQALDLLDWSKEWETILEWDLPFAKWFVGGQLNVSYNCVDRHVEAGRGDKVAFHWEGEPGDTRTITYADLQAEVSRFAAVLRSLGVAKGDRVAIYMPMIPELPVAMLACARLGAAHSVVFGGFSSESLRDRINDAEAKVLVTADGGWRRGAVIPLKENADAAVAETPSIEAVVVVRRTDKPVAWDDARDRWYHDLMAAVTDEDAAVAPEPMDAEQLLYLLYTSGTTAKPKGIMHTTGGYLTQVAFTHKYVFDLHADTDVYWCAADIGWVTGHSYIVYGPLANGATSVMYEGSPDFPQKDRWWSIVERYKVSILYTAPTAVRTFMKWGTEYLQAHDLSSLRVLGSVGEPINPEAWMWYFENVGGGRCPLMDTWWQTETGGIMISPLPGATTLKPGSATFPLPGIAAEVVDDKGNACATGGGYLTLSRPWPSMLRGIYGDPERYQQTYWSRFEGRYFAGDGARIDDEGYFWLMGRVDDVMNISGHRVSTTEVESALVDHPSVAEAAVVGAKDETTGQAIIAFVTLKGGVEADEEHGEALRQHVRTKIGAVARPKTVIFTDDLPKTRSGKIMRRLLRDVAEGRDLGDTTTLADAGVVDEIKRRAAGGGGPDEE
jgi:acetyl-CoA synthetase